MRYYYEICDTKWSNGWFQEGNKVTVVADDLEGAKKRFEEYRENQIKCRPGTVFSNFQPIEIGPEVEFTDLDVSSYYDSLYVERRDDKYFLVVPEPNSDDEAEISKELYDLLIKELKKPDEDEA